MDIFILLVSSTVRLLISVIQFCMFLRAILSFLPIGEGAFGSFLFFVTEPVIYPARRICERFGIGDGMPLDIPFFITFLMLSVLSLFL